MREIWRIIPSALYYEVSSKGRVRASAREVRFVSKRGKVCFRSKKQNIISQQFQNQGYAIAHLYTDDVRKARTVHFLVAEAFIGKRPASMDVCHNDGNRKNNRISNLRYDTRVNNFQDMKRHGTYHTRISGAKLTPTQVLAIRALRGKRKAKDVAVEFGLMNPWSVHRIWNKETWKHII